MSKINISIDLDDLAYEVAGRESNVEAIIKKHCDEAVQREIQQQVVAQCGEPIKTYAETAVMEAIKTILDNLLNGRVIHYYDTWGKETKPAGTIEEFIQEKLDTIIRSEKNYDKAIQNKLNTAVATEVADHVNRLVKEARAVMTTEIQKRVGQAVLQLAENKA